MDWFTIFEEPGFVWTYFTLKIHCRLGMAISMDWGGRCRKDQRPFKLEILEISTRRPSGGIYSGCMARYRKQLANKNPQELNFRGPWTWSTVLGHPSRGKRIGVCVEVSMQIQGVRMAKTEQFCRYVIFLWWESKCEYQLQASADFKNKK